MSHTLDLVHLCLALHLQPLLTPELHQDGDLGTEDLFLRHEIRNGLTSIYSIHVNAHQLHVFRPLKSITNPLFLGVVYRALVFVFFCERASTSGRNIGNSIF